MRNDTLPLSPNTLLLAAVFLFLILGIASATITYNVDKSGVDTGNCTVAGSPCLTIQYAINQIPGSNSDNIVVNISNGTWLNEVITVQGKTFTGSYTLAINGKPLNESTLLANGTATSYTAGYAPGTANKPTPSYFTLNGTFAGMQLNGSFVQFNHAGLYYVIMRNDNDTVWFADNSLANIGAKQFSIYLPTTIIKKTGTTVPFTINSGQLALTLDAIDFQNTGSVQTISEKQFAASTFTNCRFQMPDITAGSTTLGQMSLMRTYSYNAGATFGDLWVSQNGGIMGVAGSFFKTGAGSSGALRIATQGFVSGAGWMVGTSNTSGIGVVLIGGQAQLYGMYIEKYNQAVYGDPLGSVIQYQSELWTNFVNCSYDIVKGGRMRNDNIAFEQDALAVGIIGYNTSTKLMFMTNGNTTTDKMFAMDENGTISVVASDNSSTRMCLYVSEDGTVGAYKCGTTKRNGGDSVIAYMIAWLAGIGICLGLIRPMLGAYAPISGILLILLTVGFWTVSDGTGLMTITGYISLVLALSIILMDGLQIWRMQENKKDTGEFEPWR